MPALWNRLPFIGRLLVTASLALLIAGGAMLFISARQEAAEIRADLQAELAKELETIAGALIETVVIGDFSALQQALDRHVQRPLVAAVEFRDVSGTALNSVDAPRPAATPAWFRSLFAFPDLRGSAAVAIGGRSYGELSITLTPTKPLDRAWRHLTNHLAILLLAIGLDFVGIWLVLRSGLSPLAQLVQGTQALASGRLDVRLAADGSPELRAVIDSFNRMADAVHRAQEALQQSEERLQLATTGVNDGIWDWDIGSDRLYLSPKWKEMLGYADDELANNHATFNWLLHPDDRALVRAKHAQYLHGETASYEVEFRLRHKDGSWRWILGRGEALRDASGVAYRMAGSHADITVRRELQEMLQAKTQELRTILDNSSVGITLVRAQRLVWANRRMGELFGYRAEEMANQETCLLHLSDRACQTIGQQAQPLLAAGERYTTELEMRHRDGHPVWMRLSGQQVAGHEMADGSIWVCEDIGEQKRVEAELRAARARAEAANVAKSRFLATMSHEIRTPMNGILGMAQLLLLPDIRADERQDYARTIINSGQTMLVLLNDILDLSKVEAGRCELESIAFDPAQLIAETRALFAEAAARKGLRLEAGWDGPPQSYLGDPYRLRQMLANLVGNAIKFTAAGQVGITARQLAGDGPSAWLEFAVSDTGIGIAAEQQALLYQPFSQVDSTITRQFGGTGLGLSIVKSLARLMDGEVGVDSTPEQGSRFWFRVRAGRAEEGSGSRALPDAAAEAPVASPVPPLFRGRALVVEDHPMNRKVVEALLHKLGVSTVLAEDGQQAVDRVTRGDAGEAVDFILMDIQMPVMDGYAATAAIRRHEAEHGLPRRPIVALTAAASEKDRRQCAEVGMDDFLAKPILIDAMQATLARWLPTAAAPPARTPPAPPPPAAAVDAARVAALCAEIVPLLEGHKFDAITRFPALAAAVAGTAVAAEIADVGRLLDEFHFAPALDRLHGIARAHSWEKQSA